MGNIKETLKKNNITLKELADYLNVSRPTLDNYINLYENNKKLPKDEYNELFDQLFNANDLESALNQYLNLHNVNKINARIKRNEKNDILTSITDSIRNDLNKDDYDKSIYHFINMLLSNYRQEKVFKNLAKYFLILNGKIDYKGIDYEDKVYLSNYFHLFSEDKRGNLRFDKEYFDKFTKRIEEIKFYQESKIKDFNNRIINDVNEKVRELLSLGVDIDDIDFDSILKMIRNDR